MTRSTKTFAKVTISKGVKAWDGDNLTSNALGFDDLLSGVVFGVGKLGGTAHFKNVTQTTVSHK